MDLVRVWKDPDYRETFSAGRLAELPANPAGTPDAIDLIALSGGAPVTSTYTRPLFTNLCCFSLILGCRTTATAP